MIAIVHGTLLEKGDDHILVDAGGLGYKVHVPIRSLVGLGPVGTRVRLRTHLDVKEDRWTLFGFESPEEVRMFETLISVTGVGPKIAMALLSSRTVPEIVEGILAEDFARFTSISGVGKKTAARLFLELKEKLDGFRPAGPARPARPGEPQAARSLRDDVRLALGNLGFQAVEVEGVLDKVLAELGAEATVEVALRQALAQFRRR